LKVNSLFAKKGRQSDRFFIRKSITKVYGNMGNETIYVLCSASKYDERITYFK
jgi:hypothetical protein